VEAVVSQTFGNGSANTTSRASDDSDRSWPVRELAHVDP
jgi:hypothetical protein